MSVKRAMRGSLMVAGAMLLAASVSPSVALTGRGPQAPCAAKWAQMMKGAKSLHGLGKVRQETGKLLAKLKAFAAAATKVATEATGWAGNAKVARTVKRNWSGVVSRARTVGRRVGMLVDSAKALLDEVNAIRSRARSMSKGAGKEWKDLQTKAQLLVGRLGGLQGSVGRQAKKLDKLRSAAKTLRTKSLTK